MPRRCAVGGPGLRGGWARRVVRWSGRVGGEVHRALCLLFEGLDSGSARFDWRGEAPTVGREGGVGPAVSAGTKMPSKEAVGD